MEQLQIHAQLYDSLIQRKSVNSLVVKRVHRIEQQRDDIDIHGAYWSLGLFDFPQLAGCLHIDGEDIPMLGRKVLFIPPFSILRWRIFPGDVKWVYLIVDELLDKIRFPEPVLFAEKDLSLTENDLLTMSHRNLLGRVELTNHLGIKLILPCHPCSREAKLVIDKEFRKAANIQDVLKEVHPSFSYLSRQFKKDFGISPVRYRSGLRMIQASVDMLFKSQSVEATQLKLGLEDSSYFYASFRDYLQTTPSEFRKVARMNSEINKNPVNKWPK